MPLKAEVFGVGSKSSVPVVALLCGAQEREPCGQTGLGPVLKDAGGVGTQE